MLYNITSLIKICLSEILFFKAHFWLHCTHFENFMYCTIFFSNSNPFPVFFLYIHRVLYIKFINECSLVVYVYVRKSRGTVPLSLYPFKTCPLPRLSISFLPPVSGTRQDFFRQVQLSVKQSAKMRVNFDYIQNF